MQRGIFGLPAEAIEAEVYNVNRRKHEPKGQPAREVVDLPFRIKCKALDLLECPIFTSLYDPYEGDQQLLNMEDLGPDQMFVKSALTEGKYDDNSKLTSKDYSILVSRGEKVQRLHCAHGITLKTARVLADEGDGVSSINPPVLLTLTAKGIPLEQAMKWNGRICEWILKPKRFEFTSKDDAELKVEAQEAEAAEKAKKAKAAKKQQAKRKKNEGQLTVEGPYIPTVAQLQGLPGDAGVVITTADTKPVKFVKDDDDLWISQGRGKTKTLTSEQLLEQHPKGLTRIECPDAKLLPEWTEQVGG